MAYAVPAAAVTSSAPVTLADWDDTGLVDDFSALIQVSGVPILYADSNRGGTDSTSRWRLCASTTRPT